LKVDLLVGEYIQVVVTFRQRAITCRARILELARSHVLVSWPERNHVRIPVEFNSVDVNVLRNDAVYHFTSPVERRDEDSLVIGLPEPDQIDRIQRRSFVRVPAGFPCALKMLDLPEGGERSGKLTVHLSDLSGGGCAIQAEETLPAGCLVALAVSLPESGPLVIYGRVQRVSQRLLRDRLVHVIGIQFVELDEMTRSQIVRFVFARQREASSARHRMGGGAASSGGTT